MIEEILGMEKAANEQLNTSTTKNPGIAAGEGKDRRKNPKLAQEAENAKKDATNSVNAAQDAVTAATAAAEIAAAGAEKAAAVLEQKTAEARLKVTEGARAGCNIIFNNGKGYFKSFNAF